MTGGQFFFVLLKIKSRFGIIIKANQFTIIVVWVQEKIAIPTHLIATEISSIDYRNQQFVFDMPFEIFWYKDSVCARCYSDTNLEILLFNKAKICVWRIEHAAPIITFRCIQFFETAIVQFCHIIYVGEI